MGLRPFPRSGSALALAASVLLALALLLAPGLARAQAFPALTGPVVDAANIIPADAEARIAQKLVALKQQSQRQLQVVTVASLEGYDIADYSNRLFRTWQLGDKERNDGVMLIVAPSERKLRIEVGYGMEPIVTDGISFLVINKVIVPRFKAGDYPGGIEAGTDALIAQLSLPEDQARAVAAQASQTAKATRPQAVQSEFDPAAIIWLAIILLFFIIPMIRRLRGGRRYRSSGLGPIIMWNVLDGMSRGGGGSWSSGGDWGGGGGGWSGGGGSSGGGGASGSW